MQASWLGDQLMARRFPPWVTRNWRGRAIGADLPRIFLRDSSGTESIRPE